MKIVEFLNDKNACCGCEACVQSCPKTCICMQIDDEGFMYPNYDDKICVKCGLCEKVCPVISKELPHKSLKSVIAAETKDNEIWQKSSSGGAFLSICEVFKDTNAIVFGAKIEDERVVHGYETIDKAYVFCKSKYVQSSIGNSYCEAKKFLDQGRMVIFSGTPCQIAGLNLFLRNRRYNNLLCIDFICHGVGSPGVFKKHIEELKSKYGCEKIVYNFRNKDNYNKTQNSFITKYQIFNKSVYTDSDAYLRLFLKGICHRSSCGTLCKFANEYRFSDITIADCKHIDILRIKRKDQYNYSSIIFNTEKGAMLKQKLSNYMYVYDDDICNIAAYNSLFFGGKEDNNERAMFFEKFKKGRSISQLADEYAPIRKKTVKQQVKVIIPRPLKNLYRSMKRFVLRKYH